MLAASNRRGGRGQRMRGGRGEDSHRRRRGRRIMLREKRGGERRNLHFCLIPWVGG